MADLPTRLDLYSIGRDYLLQRAQRIDPQQVDVAGSDSNIFVGSQSVVGDVLTKQIGYSMSKHFLDGAEDDDLDRLAFDRYGLTRKGASAARGTVKFSRLSAAGGAGTIPIGTKLTSLTGVEYTTLTAASFSLGSLETVADVRASQAGKATQVGAHAIRGFSQPGQIFDRTIQVDNPLTTAGGEDVETDDVFRSRIRNFWNTARRGILGAIETGALTVPGVVSASAIEVLTGGAQPARVVNLFIADSSGVASAALGRLVATTLNEYRAAGIAVVIFTSLPFIQSIVLALEFRSGVDSLTLSDVVKGAVVEFINSLPVNGPLLIGQLFTVLQRFEPDGLIPTQASIVSPAGDLFPDVGQTFRTTPDNVQVIPPSLAA